MVIKNLRKHGGSMPQKTDYIYVGMDIHKETHTAVLMTYMEERLGKIKITNNIAGYRRLKAYVEKIQGNRIPIYGLEDVSHYGRDLAVYLLDQEYIVKEVNSALSCMERNSYATVKKNDEWDARCICSVLSRRSDSLPDANPQDYYWTMKHLVGRRDALVKNTSALVRQFHEQIQKQYPSYKKFFTVIECQTSLAFFERYPSAGHLTGVTVQELGTFLREQSHNTCSDKRAERILNLVEQDKMKEREYQSGRDLILQSITRQMIFNQQEMKRLEWMQGELLKELGYHLETIPGISTVTASALVAHIGDIKRFKNADRLANYAGVAPICHSSAGKGKNTQNKHLGNRDLYNVLYLLAMQQIQVNKEGTARNPLLRAYFEYKVSQGKTKIQAMVCIMRRLVSIIYRMMKNQTPYQMPEVESPKEQMIS